MCPVQITKKNTKYKAKSNVTYFLHFSQLYILSPANRADLVTIWLQQTPLSPSTATVNSLCSFPDHHHLPLLSVWHSNSGNSLCFYSQQNLLVVCAMPRLTSAVYVICPSMMLNTQEKWRTFGEAEDVKTTQDTSDIPCLHKFSLLWTTELQRLPFVLEKCI